MIYDEAILRILKEAGEGGLPIKKLSLHVLNACNSMFAPLDIDDVHDYVAHFLRQHPMLVERTGRRGYYRINTKSHETQQLLIDFSIFDADETANKEEVKHDEDRSLSLF